PTHVAPAAQIDTSAIAGARSQGRREGGTRVAGGGRMRSPRLVFLAVFVIPLLACGARVEVEAQATTGGGAGTGGGDTGGGGGACIGTSFPATTATPGCPPASDGGNCMQPGQVCTWTTGQSSVTYTCQMVTTCVPMAYVQWSNPVVTGDGCGGSACCV